MKALPSQGNLKRLIEESGVAMGMPGLQKPRISPQRALCLRGPLANNGKRNRREYPQEENVSTEVSASMEPNLTTPIPTLERTNSTESTSLTTESHLLTRVAETETPQPDFTPALLDTYLPSQSQAPEILNSHEESNIMGREISEESNYFNEIITPEDELLNPYDGTAAPTLDNFVDEVQATASVPPLSHKAANNSVSLENPTDTTEKIVLGIEAWKIGVISAAVFLFLETIVIIVYYRKCKKRRISINCYLVSSPRCSKCDVITRSAIKAVTR
ncbi:UNVERIFIED_CONTAM: hypothetical protein FKN15_068399 [Acipenser sinensis]